MNINTSNILVSFVISKVIHYNEKKYWKRRAEVINQNSKVPKLIRLYYLFYIKRSDAFNNASMGTDLGNGATFLSLPILPHNLNGIIIAHNATIGKNVTICQRVTIEDSNTDVGAFIGDNCVLGAGAFIKGKVKIGDNVKIGANAVVTHDIPSNCIAVGVPAKVIKRDE